MLYTMSTATQKMSFCLTISTRRGTSPSAVDGEWPTASWGRGDARVSKPTLGLEFDSGSGDKQIQHSASCRDPSDFNHASLSVCECRQADNDFLSDYVQSESLRGRGPLWSHPDGFGGLASIFHYYVDYRSDSAVQDLAGLWWGGSFHLLSASSSSFKGNLDVELDQIPNLIHD